MFHSLNDQLDNLQPEASFAKTPPLSPWIDSSENNLAPFQDGDVWANASNNKVVGKAISAHDQVVCVMCKSCMYYYIMNPFYFGIFLYLILFFC